MNTQTATIQEIEVMAANLNSLLECLAAVDYEKLPDEKDKTFCAALSVAAKYSWDLWAAIFERDK